MGVSVTHEGIMVCCSSIKHDAAQQESDTSKDCETGDDESKHKLGTVRDA